MVEPECCGTPMIHNSFTSEYECADAYFALVDDDLIVEGEGEPAAMTEADVPAEMVATLRHWRESRRPDGSADVMSRG